MRGVEVVQCANLGRTDHLKCLEELRNLIKGVVDVVKTSKEVSYG